MSQTQGQQSRPFGRLTFVRSAVSRKRRLLFFKGIVSRDEYFFEVLKIKIVLCEWALMIFTILAVVLWRNSKMKFLLTSIKSLTNCENSSSNPLKRACSGFLMAACDSKSCFVSGLWFWKPVMNVHWRKLTNESQGKPEQKYYAASGTIFSICKCFQRGKLYINFSLEQDRLKM